MKRGPAKLSSKKKAHKCDIVGLPYYFLAKEKTGMRGREFPSEKLRILSDKGVQELRYLFDELSTNDKKKRFLQQLPPEGSYQDDKLPALYRRLDMFLSILTNPANQHYDKAWHFYTHLWLCWIEQHENLHKALLEFDYQSDKDADEDTAYNRPVDILCFKFLSQKSLEGKITRELLEDFYNYGYFLPSEEIENIISLSKSKAEVGIFEKIDQILLDQSSFREKFSDHSAIIQAQTNKLNDIHIGLEDSRKELKATVNIFKQQEDQYKKLESLYGECIARTEIHKLLNDSQEKLKDSIKSTLSSGIQSIEASARKELKKEVETLSKAHETLIKEVESFQESLTLLQEQFLAYKDIKPLECKPINEPEGKRTPTQEFELTTHTSPPLLTKLSCDYAESISILSVGQAETILYGNLTGLGLIKSEARKLSKIILSALFAGNLVLFKGAYSTIIAHIVAKSFCGRSTYSKEIPVGLLNGQEISVSTDYLAKMSYNKDISALILTGMNRSPIECYGDSIDQIMGKRIFKIEGQLDNVFLLGTLNEGPGCLSLTRQLCQYGPIIDLDKLNWKLTASPNILTGYIEAATWQSWRSSIGNNESGLRLQEGRTHELIDSSLTGLAALKNSLWLRNLEQASLFLRAIYGNTMEDTVIPTLFKEWILPYSAACGIEQEILDGWELDYCTNELKVDTL